MKSAYVFGAAFTLGTVAGVLNDADAATVAVTAAAFTFETSGIAIANASSSGTSLGPILAESGLGTASVVHSTSRSATYTSPSGNGSAHSLASSNWGAPDYYKFDASTIGISDIVISFDQAATSNGPKVFAIQASSNGGGAYTSFAGVGNFTATTATGFGATSDPSFHYTFDFSFATALNNKSDIAFRFQNQDFSNSPGLSFVDNVFITGDSPLPEPASLTVAAAALGGLAVRRRK